MEEHDFGYRDSDKECMIMLNEADFRWGFKVSDQRAEEPTKNQTPGRLKEGDQTPKREKEGDQTPKKEKEGDN